jgi:MarR family transcriptional regulator, organic hydroperoxide resistance regulator
MSSSSSNAADARLADFLCFAVYSANLAYGKAYRPILDQLGLTYTQYITLICLYEQDGQSVSELGGKLFLESNTLTPILKKLEAMGYVRRQRSKADERVLVVSLTDKGKRLREQARGKNLVAATGLGAQEFKALQKSVSRLRDALIESTQDGA